MIISIALYNYSRYKAISRLTGSDECGFTTIYNYLDNGRWFANYFTTSIHSYCTYCGSFIDDYDTDAHYPCPDEDKTLSNEEVVRKIEEHHKLGIEYGKDKYSIEVTVYDADFDASIYKDIDKLIVDILAM